MTRERIGKIIVALICTVFILSTTAAVTAQENTDSNGAEIIVRDPSDMSYFEDGLKLYYEKRFAESQSMFREVLEQDPNDTIALSFLLSTCYRTDNLIETVNGLEKKSIEMGEPPIMEAQVGVAYFSRGLIDNDMIEESRRKLKEVLEQDPDLPLANTGMGMIYYQKRLIPRAKGYFVKALKFNHDDIMALERLGEILMIDDNNAEGALEYFNKIIEISPGYSDGYFYAASANQRLGNEEEAVRLFKKTMEIDPLGVLKGYNAPLRLGDLYLEKEEWDEAKKYYEKALAINPENPYALTQLEKAEKKGKQWEGEDYHPLDDKIEEKGM